VNTKPTIQQVQRQVAQARDDLKHEAGGFVKTVGEQISGREQAPGVGQSNPQIQNPDHFQDTQALWADEQKKNEDRMQQLRFLINQMGEEERKAKMASQQQQETWQKAQAEAMKASKPKEDEKKGMLASISRAAKRVKGRLGHVGKGKMEKGRAAGG